MPEQNLEISDNVNAVTEQMDQNVHVSSIIHHHPEEEENKEY